MGRFTKGAAMAEEARTLEFQERINRLTEVGIALSAELNLAVLLEKALHHARELAQADAGTIYLLQEGHLHFRILQNETLGVFLGGASGGAITLPPVDLSPSNVSAQAALEGRTIRLDDVYESSEYDFSGPRRYDAQTGYRSKSMLVVPMRNHEREIIGVLQLINHMDPVSRTVAPFPDFTVSLTEALASQAAVAITNANLIEETRNLFESLIHVLATAIDQKSPYTGEPCAAGGGVQPGARAGHPREARRRLRQRDVLGQGTRGDPPRRMAPRRGKGRHPHLGHGQSDEARGIPGPHRPDRGAVCPDPAPGSKSTRFGGN